MRVPLIDHKLVEFLFLLPSHLKWRDGRAPKYLLKKAVEDLLPEENIYREKSGFELPFDTWMRYELKSSVEQSLIELEDRGIFPHGFVTQQWHDFLSKKQVWSRVWQLFVLSKKIPEGA